MGQTQIVQWSKFVKPDSPVSAIKASDVAPRTTPSNYPEPFRSRMAGRMKAPLGDFFGLSNFGVNFTRLAPGSVTALHHRHSRQDEMIYVISGSPTLITDTGETTLEQGMVAGFPAGGTPHHLENRTQKECVILEIGDRSIGDIVSYPVDDLQGEKSPSGEWNFTHKDGSPYD